MTATSTNSQRREIVKTIRLTKSEVVAIQLETAKLDGESGHRMSFSDYIRSAIEDALEQDFLGEVNDQVGQGLRR